MSRVGKLPIPIPGGVSLSVSPENVVTVKGKLGSLSQAVTPGINVTVDGDRILVTRPNDEKEFRSKHGLYRALIANMVKGVSEGFTSIQELVGVGYKATANGQVLELALGYSHNIIFELPQEIKLETTAEKGKNPTIILSCTDRQLLGHVTSKIRSLRPPEPYKGKGIRYKGEVVRKKAGKSASDK